MRKKIKFMFLAICLASIQAPAVMACPLCAVAVESNKNSGGDLGRAINLSIYFMLSMPLLLTGIFGVGLFMMLKRHQPLELPGQEPAVCGASELAETSAEQTTGLLQSATQ